MRDVALEMNLSETAFLHREAGGYRLRWFTPTVEVALCGHATLAAAHVLWEEGELDADEPAMFYTRSGPLRANRRDGRIELDFPAQPVVECSPPAGFADALGSPARFIGRNGLDYLAEVANERVVRELTPDLSAFAKVDARGVIVTAAASALTACHDFVSRFFAPAAGVLEDPVTGSAHCALAPYWSAKLGRDELVGFQASARTGVVGVRMHGDRVLLSGKAITILRGELAHDPEFARQTDAVP